MIATLGIALAASLMSVEQSGDGNVVLRHDISPKYNRTDYDSACGSTVFGVRFRNGPGDHGRVDQVSIDGRPVVGAAEQLQIRAARRVISRIGIMNCGPDPGRPVFRAVMELSPIESRSLGMSPSLYFRLSRQAQGDWQLSID